MILFFQLIKNLLSDLEMMDFYILLNVLCLYFAIFWEDQFKSCINGLGKGPQLKPLEIYAVKKTAK
jgi:hypothetical protein